MELIKKARTKMLQFYLQLLETEEELQKFTQLYETYRKADALDSGKNFA